MRSARPAATTSEAIQRAGRLSLPVMADVRDQKAVEAAVDASVARLGEMTLLLSANETAAGTGRDAPMSSGSRSRLSAELQALLRDLTRASDRDPPG